MMELNRDKIIKTDIHRSDTQKLLKSFEFLVGKCVICVVVIYRNGLQQCSLRESSKGGAGQAG